MGASFLSQRFLHRGVGEPHIAERNRIALLRDIAALFKEVPRRVTGIDLERLSAARGCELLQRVDQHGGGAVSARRRMDEKHVDLILALERGKSDRRALEGRNEGQLRSEEHTSELQSLAYLVCRLLLEKKK